MKVKDLFLIAANNVRRRKLRSWLTVIGIVIGITAIVALMIVGRGMENAVEEAFEDFGTDVILVRGSAVVFGPPGPGELGISEDDRGAIERAKGVDFVIPFLWDTASVEFHGEELITGIVGYEPGHMEDLFSKTRYGLKEGRFFEKSESGVAIIGYRVQDDFFEDSVGIKNRIKIGNKTFKVIGILEEIGNAQDDFSISISMDDAREIFGEEEGYTAVMAIAEPGVDVEDTAEKIKKELKDERGDENFRVFTATQLVEQITGILAVIRIVLVGIAAIALLVGAIGIMNTMYMSVLERTREIGIMKSIGAPNEDIMKIFLIESAIFGFVGAIIGTVIGIGISLLVGIIVDKLQLGIPFVIIIRPGVPIFAVIFGVVVGMLSGYLPARNASKKNPVDALRYE